MRTLALLIFTLAISGCANGYEKFYQASPPPPPGAIQFVNFVGEPRVMTSSGNLAEDAKHMYEDGYGLVGVSSFIGPAANQSGAIAQAKKVGAAVVIVLSKYQSTATGAIPITTTTPQTTYNNGTVTAYGSGGAVSGNYSGTSTTYTQQTTMIPYSVDRYDQVAGYFRPLERKGFGIQWGALSQEQRQQAGTNKGLVVVIVRKGSPAFLADILPGDIVMAMNDQPLYDAQAALALMATLRGTTVNFDLVRNGAGIKKSVVIPAGEW